MEWLRSTVVFVLTLTILRIALGILSTQQRGVEYIDINIIFFL